MSKFCIHCGTQLVDEARFCSNCGKPQQSAEIDSADVCKGTPACIVEEATAEVPTATQEAPACAVEEEVSEIPTVMQKEQDSFDTVSKPKKKLSVPILIRNAVLLAVAVIMFAFSFAPIYEEEAYGDELYMEVSPVNLITFMFDSFKTEDDDDLMDSPLYDEIEELSEKIQDEYDEDTEELTPRGKRLRSKCLILMYRLVLQSEEYPTGISEILPAVVSFIYMLLTLALLVFATLNFISSFMSSG